MFAGVDSADKDPRKSLHVSDVPVPELAPDEAYVAVMASSINFNTVWTSIFEPLPTFGFLDRLGKESAWGARHALDHHVVGSDASGVVAPGRLGRAQLAARRQGRRALQLRRRPGPLRPRRLHAGGQPAHLGLRVELRRPGRPRRGEGQPAHAQGAPPQLGGGGDQRPVQLDRLPDARVAQRRGHEAGRPGPRVGWERGPRELRRPARPERGRHPGRRGVLARQGGPAPRARRRGGDRPRRGRATGSGRTSTPRTSRSGAASARTSAPSSATSPTSSSSIPVARPWVRRCSSASGPGPSSPARRPRAT